MTKIILLLITASVAFSINSAFAYTCESDNKVYSNGQNCCCREDTSTTDNSDYVCSPKAEKCSSTETALGMKDKDGNKVCPCKITIKD